MLDLMNPLRADRRFCRSGRDAGLYLPGTIRWPLWTPFHEANLGEAAPHASMTGQGRPSPQGAPLWATIYALGRSEGRLP
jgi:hypothetical protein